MEGFSPAVHYSLAVNDIIVQKYCVWHSFENVVVLNTEGQIYEVRDTSLKECVLWEERA